MKAFIWKKLNNVSSSYHSGGGLMVIAKDLDRAREIAVFSMGYGEDKQVVKMDTEKDPDFTFAAPKQKEQVVVFEDAGCC